MAAPLLKAVASGKTAPFKTSVVRSNADRATVTVTVEGPQSALEALGAADIAAFVPKGYTYDTSQLSSSGDGLGKLDIRATDYGNPQSGNDDAPIRTTFRVEMAEVQYDLEDHPRFASRAGTRDIILRWLATEASARSDGANYYYTDTDGSPHQIADEHALAFIAAYMAGIKTFVRYYPVIEKISIWRKPPGMNMSGNSFTGGAPAFSAGIGTYDTPPLTLNGYSSSGGWFKSGDKWTSNENKTWTRTEQWTYTPEGADGTHGWIYGGSGPAPAENNNGGSEE